MTMRVARACVLVVAALGGPSSALAVDNVEDAALAATSPVRGVSVLLRQGGLVFEPGLQYAHSSGTQVAIEGYTIIPTLLIGLINVSEVQRDTLTATATLRYGLAHRLEVELKVPYVYREEEVREREVFGDAPTDIIRGSRGSGLGDVEFALRYQLNSPSGGGPFYLGSLRAKTRTGTDPFEVERAPLYVDGNEGTPVYVGEVYREQPTGSGFWSLQPGLSFILPTEPAVLFGSLSYLWNIAREVEDYGRVDPGDSIGFNFGMGFGINERTSFNLGYDHHIVNRTRRENDAGLDATFSRFHVGSLLFGVSHRLGARSSLNLSVAVGVTESAPNVQLGVRMPMALN